MAAPRDDQGLRQKMLKWKIEWYSGGFEVIEADDFEAAAKKATRIAKRRFLRVTALYQSKEG